MRFKRKSFVIVLGMILAGSMVFGFTGQGKKPEELFQQAKIFIFDREWDQAEKILNRILDEYPLDPIAVRALFYKGKCLKEMSKREEESLAVYKEFITKAKKSDSLVEEADLAVIDLGVVLYEKGQKKYLTEVESRLNQSNRVVRYYAAYKMSQIKDKKSARKALPVLQEILKKETDSNLLDRARIALLRIDPEALKDMPVGREKDLASTFHIEVLGKWSGEPVFSLSLPWSLADLALGAIPEEEKAALNKGGYDIDRVISELIRYKGKIMEFVTEKTIIKIWIE